MEKIRCLSLCEMLFKAKIDKISVADFIEKAISVSPLKEVDRIYLGSNFCSRYFLNCPNELYFEAFEFCKAKNIAVTLVVPTFSQRDLAVANERIGELLSKNIVDEITVNDYGMLERISSNFDIKINVGRLLNKDTRDQRFFTYTDQKREPDVFTLNNSVLKNYKINCYEFDVTNSVMDFTSSTAECALYTEYTYNTYGNICEYAGIGKSTEKKFRTNDKCACQCMQVSIEYLFNDNFKYQKFGRAIYFKHGDFSVVSNKPYREIFQPLDLIRGGKL